MSKSLGNVLSIGALTEEYPAVAVRWALSTVHHRLPSNGALRLPTAHAAWEKFPPSPAPSRLLARLRLRNYPGTRRPA